MTQPHYLLDTNIVSELSRARPNSFVAAFFEKANRLSISVMVLHELQFGCETLTDPDQRARLIEFIAMVRGHFSTDCLPITLEIAETAARLRAFAKRKGRVLAVSDALIAATGMIHGLTLATRNVKDFAILGVPILNPFEAA